MAFRHLDYEQSHVIFSCGRSAVSVEITPDGGTYLFGTRSSATDQLALKPSLTILPPFVIECFQNPVREENQCIPLLQDDPFRRILGVFLYAKRQATTTLFHRLCRLGPKLKRASMACKAQVGVESRGINHTAGSRDETLHAQVHEDFVHSGKHGLGMRV